ncbi:hypothetical protein NADFUDRAFT_39212 [Nadsonia fulvescens var. elongata DSM 6958]|uniref:Zinc/iron permease n=1 Tax=Nadsonia fulvescens var. elongata DSM 6958 TaxID=857566 RepID=A0A1E3PQU2_9ASCO|nr:hypothetical protein NADFUDRAFT_39212 [Nadsonia fulvescens var. elongata DSM 6958]
MSGLVNLLLLCLLMGIGALGMGILVSTALVVIIPEGVETLYSVTHTVSTGSPSMSSKGDNAQTRNSDGDENGDNSSVIGLALLFGFLLIYRRRVGMGSKGGNNDGFLPISVDIAMLRMERSNVNQGSLTDPSVTEQARPAGSPNMSPTSSLLASTSTSTTIGLVIHAIADGIALGSAVASDNAALETVVFFAIIIHKAPASFGLSAVLLRDANLTVNQVKARLVTFAAAAPVGAILTYIMILFLSKVDGGGATIASPLAIQYWTGVLLLFSGGTFLYVSVHVMQEIQSNQSSDSNEVIGGHNHSARMSDIDFVCSFVGMLLPLLTLLINE